MPRRARLGRGFRLMWTPLGREGRIRSLHTLRVRTMVVRVVLTSPHETPLLVGSATVFQVPRRVLYSLILSLHVFHTQSYHCSIEPGVEEPRFVLACEMTSNRVFPLPKVQQSSLCCARMPTGPDPAHYSDLVPRLVAATALIWIIHFRHSEHITQRTPRPCR